MSVPSTSIVLVVAISFFLADTATADDQTQQLIDNVCRQMEDYGFCNQAFHQNLKNPSTDIRGLTHIAIDLTNQNATNTYNYIKPILDKATTPEVKRILGECVKDYQQIMTSFQHGAAAFAAGNYNDMMTQMRPAPKAIGMCDRSIGSAEPKFPVHPYFFLIDRNKAVRILIAMSIASGHNLVS